MAGTLIVYLSIKLAGGIGFIFGVMIKGGDEQTELVRVRHQ